MKKILTLFIIAFFAITVKGEINLFSYNADRVIISSKSFIDDFFWESDMPLVDVESFLMKVMGETEYRVNLGKIPDPDSDGMFNQIQILSGSKALLTLRNIDSWERTKYNNNKYYIQIPLSSTCMALCFIGHCYDSTPPLLTIVVVNKNHASLVFNQECCFLSYINNNKEFSIVYSDQIQETNDDGSPYPATNQLKQWKIWKDGDMLKHTQIN